MDRVTSSEFADLVDLDNNEGEPFEFVTGKFVNVRGCTKSEFITGIVRRFPAVERQFVQSSEDEMRAIKLRAQGVEVADRPSEAEYLQEQFRSGPELRNAMIAICCNRIGDEVYERAVGKLRDEKRDALLKLACDKSWAHIGFAGFLELIVYELMGLGAMAAITGAATMSSPTSAPATSPATSSSGSSAPAGA